jgi:hypothetical protein
MLYFQIRLIIKLAEFWALLLFGMLFDLMFVQIFSQVILKLGQEQQLSIPLFQAIY